MRRRKSFLLTVIPSDVPQNAFCGQVKSIDTGKAFYFNNIDELKQLLMCEISGGLTKPLAQAVSSGTLPDPSTN
jgi:hypothetical protein